MKIKPVSDEFQFRKGDVVALRASVKYDWSAGDEFLHVKVDGHYGDITVKRECVAGLVAPSLDDGDKVQSALGLGTVRAVRGDNAWIELDAAGDDGKKHHTLPLLELDRVADPDFAEVEEVAAAPALETASQPAPSTDAAALL